MWRPVLCCALIGIWMLGEASAEEFPFQSNDKEFQAGFGSEGGISQMEKVDSERDKLKVGGELWARLGYFGLKGQGERTGYLFSPNMLYLYFDSHLRKDTRAYIRLLSIYDPTASKGGVSPFTGQSLRETQVAIEEMKLLFNINKTVFFTVGKQKIRWGSSKFWNPTDYMNSSGRDLLYNVDQRLGVNLIKTHLPLGSANLYLVNRIEGSNDPGQVQHALRAEVPIGTAEFATTATFQNGVNPIWGMDVSSALWDLDVYAEFSQFGQANYLGYGSAYNRLTTGLSYDYKYSDQDLVTFSVEYFRNGAGVTDTTEYAGILLRGAYQPFFLARNYGMFMIYLPTPGHWEHVSFTLFNLLNLTDGSGVSKIMATLTQIEDLKVDLGLSGHFGNSDGELKLGGQFVDADLRLRVQF